MRCKMRFLYGVIAAVLLTGPACAAAPETAPPEQAQPCTPVARIFSRTICREEVELEAQHLGAIREQYENEGLDSEKALKTRSQERLRDLLWEEALDHRFGKPALEPTAEETALFSRVFRESLEKSHTDNISTAEKLRALLATGQYDGAKEQEMRALLQSLEKSIAFYKQREEYRDSMPPEFHDLVTETERGMAEKMVRTWKINRALYREYGGRLAMNDGTPEPVDAIAKFLIWVKSGLDILDPSYKGVLRPLELRSAHPRDLIPETETAIYENYYADPVWQFNRGESE